MTRSLRLHGGLMLATSAAVALELAGWHSPVRALAVAGFVLIVPGWALLDIWSLARGWAGIAFVLGTNVALATIVPLALLYAGLWSPTAALLILAAIAAGATAAAWLRGKGET
jgi:hypothetical protein